MIETITIPGPLGPFLIPANPPRTREVCEYFSKQLWDGEYDFAELPTEGPLTVLDIGACIGAFSVWAIAKWRKNLARLVCYEPHLEAFEIMGANISNAQEQGVRVPDVQQYRVAVTDVENAVYACNEDWCAGRTEWQTEGINVPLLHPRDLPACDICKIDAEGVEVRILEHYPAEHMANVKALLLEFHDIERRDGIRRLATAAGFRLVREEPERGYGVSLWTR